MWGGECECVLCAGHTHSDCTCRHCCSSHVSDHDTIHNLEQRERKLSPWVLLAPSLERERETVHYALPEGTLSVGQGPQRWPDGRVHPPLAGNRMSPAWLLDCLTSQQMQASAPGFCGRLKREREGEIAVMPVVWVADETLTYPEYLSICTTERTGWTTPPRGPAETHCSPRDISSINSDMLTNRLTSSPDMYTKGRGDD